MEPVTLLQQLNDSQRAAVEYIDGPSLVIAGAGSGKTRVLTYKIAWLLLNGVKPWEIMALTFTNKAAREMRSRIETLAGESAQYLRMGTFHSIFARLLRSEITALGYDRNFTIYDEADSRSLCKSIVKDLGLDDKIYKPAEVHRRISDAKNRLLRAEDYARDTTILSRDIDSSMPQMSAIYNMYSQRCRTSNAMDFDDLLINTFYLFKLHPEICKKYATSYRYFLVDEYQDTNYAQQQIMLQLTSQHHNICVVGDDAQSIYAFRGANIDNILEFQQQYAEARLFKLERNYRSTKRIVEAANSLIHKNERQIDKDVYSENADGEKVRVAELASDREETSFVSRDIQRLMRSEGLEYSDFAILYRTNSQSRMFEEQFVKEGVPYHIYGGLSFYQRKEIKDITAFLRIVVNPDDEEAFRRIINYPARGIGDTTLQKLLNIARERGISLWQVAVEATDGTLPTPLNSATLTRIHNFRLLIEGFMARLQTDDAATLGKDIIRQSGISKDIYSSTDPEYLSKQEHMEEFVSSMQEFVESRREEGEPDHLIDFLQEVSLLSDMDRAEEGTPQVTLMTIHSAKGLEFPCVYIVGMEENIFPSPLCTQSKRALEEERRLLYVAITRAEQHCTMTYAHRRYRYGKMEFGTPSRFLRDIDRKLLAFEGSSSDNTYESFTRPRQLFQSLQANTFSGLSQSRMSQTRGQDPSRDRRNAVTTPERSGGRIVPVTHARNTSVTSFQSASYDFKVGDRVRHQRFGEGTITSLTNPGDSAKAMVDFEYAGTKQLLLKFAKLEKIG
jgi:DNA helicase-2/ATP-dependent DNA helicase PcrA